MSISAQLDFVRNGKVVESMPQSVTSSTQQVESHTTDTPFQYVQGVFDILARYGPDGQGFILVRDPEPFDSVQVRWPLDGALYTWEAVLLRNSFRIPPSYLNRLVDKTSA
jgi:hypothetical protein